MIKNTEFARAALVHYWLVNHRGGESVLEEIAKLLPNSDIYTHTVNRDILFGQLKEMNIRTTFIQKLPMAQKLYPAYLPLMPMALEALNMNKYDLIISSESGPAKWVIPAPGAKHICYCHSPMRYIWDQRQTYFDKLPRLARPLAHLAASGLRKSDALSSLRVTHFVANSTFVSKRIQQYYRRDSEIIHPPVNVGEFDIGQPEDFYLCAGQVVSYKRVDLAVEACRRLGRRLVIVGGGNTKRLQQLAGPHTEFLGAVDYDTLKSLMRRCKALLFPGLEDFGIVPVEVMASGRPIIAYGSGGAIDTVEPGKSGILFEEQTVDALIDAIAEFERSETRLTQANCQSSAMRFDSSVFRRKFSRLIETPN